MIVNTLMTRLRAPAASFLTTKSRSIVLSSVARAGSNIFHVQDEADFQKRVVQSAKPVIVDFHAAWCGPCKILGPRIEKLMAEYEGKAEFAKVDIDNLSDLAMNFNVSSVPTVIAVKEGKTVGKFVGLIDDDKIRAFVKENIDK